ncbi:aldehyde dehydrogenase family protein [Microcella daejeonensis]|uniref:aldehyde dehydrogenase family protein n=1 Tax=Microcella daejeonensis TaxID=2994971 RepID=UPI00226D6A66|nr:aldehyde dehydrogenase family protein [Microcella daejeonensis]WAB84531.1 aldehyde dehydrogenase family protein [Microcella daejeonensis]
MDPQRSEPARAELRDDLGADLTALRSGAERWLRTPLAAKRSLLREVRASTLAAATEWVAAACAVKGIPTDSPAAGEEWTTGPYSVIGATLALEQTLAALEKGEQPLADRRVRRAAGDRLAVQAFPLRAKDAVLAGFGAEVWLRPGVSIEDARAGVARALRDPDRAPRVTLVLGAGNITGIPALDVLTALYQEASAAIVKLNPVNAAVGDAMRRAFAPFIDADVLRIVEGDHELGAELIAAPEVEHVHITGSRATHDAIVWGPGEQGEARRSAGTPLLGKPITSELGGVGPAIVVPDARPWSSAEIAEVARAIASQRLHNSGFNCIATQLVVLPAAWPQADALVAALRGQLALAPVRPAYYPGAAERRRAALEGHPDAVSLGGDPVVPRALVDHLVSADAEEPLFTTEVFGPVLGVVRLPGSAESAAFLDAAVAFANDRLAGTLSAGLIVHPRTQRALGPDLEAAIAALRYGTIAVNSWVGPIFGMPAATWGAFPGHTLDDVGSGIGVVHNALLLDPEHVERTVGRGPWRDRPTPLWDVRNATAHRTAEALTRFAARDDLAALPAGIAAVARYLRG